VRGRRIASARLAVLLALATPLAAQAPPPSFEGETVEVNVRVVPFYAVDAHGLPVFDLQKSDVELLVGGKAVAIDSFDAPKPVSVGARTGAAAPAGVVPPRQVVVLVDGVFTTPEAFRNTQRVAEHWLGALPATDRVFLLYHGSGGMQRALGPLVADADGKARLKAALGALKPEVRRLSTDPSVDLGPLPGGGTSRAGSSDDQLDGAIDNLQAAARSEYTFVAKELADSLDLVASQLRRMRGPRLLAIFWEGLDDDLFYNGDVGATQPTLRVSPLHQLFTKPLKAIADSGAFTVFVNTAADQGPNTTHVAHDLARAAGAFYAGGADANLVGQVISDATSAYYEISFTPAAGHQARAEVEVVVHRPGVKVMAAPAVRLSETWAELSQREQQLLVIDLASGGTAAQRGAARLHAEQLEGQVLTERREGGHRGFRFEPVWPHAVTRGIEVYNVALTPPPDGKASPVLRLFEHRGAAELLHNPLEIVLGQGENVIWGIVAIEPATGRAWFRSLHLEAPSAGAQPHHGT
jgi:hypothetical protein